MADQELDANGRDAPLRSITFAFSGLRSNAFMKIDYTKSKVHLTHHQNHKPAHQ